jgi:hypothetical protein
MHMETKGLIAVREVCECHHIDLSFVNSLNEHGLLKIVVIEETQYIYPDDIKDLEKMIRLHYDLNVNIEGIDAISHLLQLVENLHEELTVLKNRLRLYEG